MENSEAFEPYATYRPATDNETQDQSIFSMTEAVKAGAPGWPIDGDMNNRNAAKELGSTLRAIAAGPKISGNISVQVLPDIMLWQRDVLNASAVALPEHARMTISPRRNV